MINDSLTRSLNLRAREICYNVLNAVPAVWRMD